MRRLLLSVLLFSAIMAVGSAAERPNILLVVSDDQGYGDSTGFWNTDLQTPVMDAIGQAGVKLTHFRVNPLCAPTRASFMTGLSSLEAGMWRGPGQLERGPKPAAGWPRDARRIRDGIQLLPQYLKDAGYATGMFGKWHLGYDPENVPNARGFDEFVGFLGGAHPYYQPRNRGQLEQNGKPLGTDKHTTDLFADEAISFIKANKDRPFFCYVPFNAVHGPLHSADRPRNSAKPEWLEKYKHIPQPRRDYCAVMSHADARVGDMLAVLRELDLEKKTLVIYFSDNGGILEKYPSNNGPFRGGKGEAYEGGLRVPAVIKWPGVIPPGTISEASAVHFDIFATLLEAAGIEVPKTNGDYKVSGQSLLEHLRSGGKTPLAERYLFWDLYGKQAALKGDWKLVGNLPNHRGDFQRAAKDAEAAEFELYNLKADPGEKKNLAAEQREIYQDLKRRHVEWLGSGGRSAE
jgi:arylsulfatase A-like enzyme